MPDDADDLLERWLDSGKELLAARKGSQREAQLQERIEKLEARFKEEPIEEQQDALNALDADERKLIAEHRAGKAKPPPVAEEPPVVEEPKRKTRPGRKSGKAYHWTVDENERVQRVDIPHIYSGADEPDEVELPEDEPAVEDDDDVATA